MFPALTVVLSYVPAPVMVSLQYLWCCYWFSFPVSKVYTPTKDGIKSPVLVYLPVLFACLLAGLSQNYWMDFNHR